MCVLVSEHVPTHTCIYVCTFMCGGCRSSSGVGPQDAMDVSFEAGSLCGLELAGSNRLASQGAPGIHLSLFPQL